MSNFIIEAEEKEVPDIVTLYNFIKRVTVSSKMESEIPILSLIYIERLMSKQGVLINEDNWKGIVLTTLCLGSKIWDDDSLENEHFPKVLPEFPLRLISRLEKSFLELVEFDMRIKGSVYAKTLFTLVSLADEEIMKGQ